MGMEFRYEGCTEDGWGWNDIKRYPNWKAAGTGNAIKRLVILAGYSIRIPDDMRKRLEAKGVKIDETDDFGKFPDMEAMKKKEDPLLYLSEMLFGQREELVPHLGLQVADRLEGLLDKYPEDDYDRWSFGQLVQMLREAAKRNKNVEVG